MFQGKNNKAEKSSIRTSLTLDEDVISDINQLKIVFPQFTKTNMSLLPMLLES